VGGCGEQILAADRREACASPSSGRGRPNCARLTAISARFRSKEKRGQFGTFLLGRTEMTIEYNSTRSMPPNRNLVIACRLVLFPGCRRKPAHIRARTTKLSWMRFLDRFHRPVLMKRSRRLPPNSSGSACVRLRRMIIQDLVITLGAISSAICPLCAERRFHSGDDRRNLQPQ